MFHNVLITTLTPLSSTNEIDQVSNHYPVFIPNATQRVQTEQILWDQYHNVSAYANCDGYQVSPNYESEITYVEENKNMDDMGAIYSANSCQSILLWNALPPEIRMSKNHFIFKKNAREYLQEKNGQQLVRETLEPYLRFHSQERKHRGKFAHNRPSKTIAKRKSRTVFNTEQILLLERIFKKKPYVSRQERQLLVQTLNVNDRVIKVWFQNRRRLSGVNQRELDPIGTYSDSSTEEIDTSFNLSYVESKIKDADEFGYVTLDDRAMNELITAVDAVLSDIDLNEIGCTNIDFSVDTIKYEPISPVSINDYEEEVSYMPQWEPNEPEVSLRHLFDVQALMSV